MEFRDKFLSIQKKLTLLTILPVSIITAVSFSFIMNQDLTRLRNELVNETHSYIELLSQDIVKIIVVGNVNLAADMTSQLHNHESIDGIIIYDLNHSPVFTYRKNGIKKIASIPANHQQKQLFSEKFMLMQDKVIYQDTIYGEIFLQISTKKMLAARNNYFTQGVIITLALLFTVILLFRQIGRYFLQPIEQLAATLKHIAETQDFTAQLPVERHDEIGELFAGFNRMQEQVLQANKNLLDQQQALNEHAIVTITDVHGAITYANQKFTDISGYSQTELLGKNHQIINSGMHSNEFFQTMYDAITSGQVWRGDICNRTKRGSIYWVSTTIVPFMDKHGKPEQYIALHTDISRQKMTDKALTLSKERLDMAMSVANDGLWDWRLDANSVYFDARYYTMAGYEPFEFALEFEQFQKRVHPDHINALMTATQQYLEGESNNFDVEFEFMKKDGSYMWIRGRGNIVERDNKGKPLRFVGTHSDITMRKQAEYELIESEQRYRQIFETNQAIKLIIDEDNGRIVEANEAAVQFYGYDVEALTSMHITDINILSDEEMAHEMQKAGNRKRLHFNFRHQLASGEIRDVEVYSGPVCITGKSYLYSIVHDITERIQVEKQLRRSQKMDAVGQLTGGIAHDFNNILSIIIGNVSLLERQLGANEKLQKRISTIKYSTQRAIDLTRQLLGFSRKKATSVKAVDINQIITNMHSLVVHSLTPQVKIEHRLAENLWLTEIDTGDFEDALLNLILNARDAMSGSGKIMIESRNITLDKTLFEHNEKLDPGEYIELAISDNGEGMSVEQQEHIFEPFFTTKDQGNGTGLGLAMVFGFVTRSHGGIKVYSESEIGTTFRLFLPRFAWDEPLPIQEVELTEDPVHGDETILAVDDEAALLDLVQESLQLLGYRVLTAENGKQALQILADKQPIDLLFSDVVMPGINGFELAEQAQTLYPELKILLTSGYTKKAIANNGQSRFAANLLTKPYNQIDLAQQLRQILGNNINDKQPPK